MSAQRQAYTSDLTDEAWQLLQPLLPRAKPGGLPQKYAMRDVLDGIQYVLRGGCAWRLMPHDLPHWQTAYQTFRAWRQDGTWQRIHDQLRELLRTRMGRHPQPSAAIIDAQTVKITETGGPTSMMGPRNSTAAHVISSWIRRVSSCVSSSTPRTFGTVSQNYGPNVTMLGALGAHGLQAIMTVDGPLDTAVFRAYIKQVLGPTLASGDIVVLDNLGVHKARGIQQRLARRRVRLLYLPPYSPDLAPIEPCWSKVKTALRRAKARTRSALDSAITSILPTVTAADARGWFRHCGYTLHSIEN